MIARPDEAAIFCTGAAGLTPEINRIFRAARHGIGKKLAWKRRGKGAPRLGTVQEELIVIKTNGAL